jgi:hypothetical protein
VDYVLPTDAVLLHIGTFKTGTSSLQGAFHLARDEVAANGVHYAGRNRQPMLATLALTGSPGRRGDPLPEPRNWHALVEEVASFAGRKRVVVSSEFFADADDDRAGDAVRELGGSRVQVVITLRPLAKILPSQWQQYIQNGLRMGYDDWLDRMFNQPPYERPTPTFWQRHDHAALVRRWVAAAGAENVTVIVVDESDRLALLRTFESLLGLPDGILVPDPSDSNRSLSLSEVELVSQLNAQFSRRKWSEENYRRFVREAVVKPLLADRQPLPGEPMITTPAWALARAAEKGIATVKAIADTGVHVIGNPDLLALADEQSREEGSTEPLVLPVSAVATTVINTILASRKAQWKRPESLPQPTPEPPPLIPPQLEDRPARAIDSRELARLLWTRARRRVEMKVRARLPHR